MPIFILSCGKGFEIKTYYVVGDNIKVKIYEYEIVFTENDKLVFKASTNKDSKLKSIYKIKEVGDNPTYIAKYVKGKLVTIKFLKDNRNNFLMYISGPLKRVYKLRLAEEGHYVKKGLRLLSYSTDVHDFTASVKAGVSNLYVVTDHYFTEISASSRLWDGEEFDKMLKTPFIKWLMEEPYKDNPTRQPVRVIKTMEDFMLDQNQKTGWVSKKKGSNHRINITFKSIQGAEKLNRSVMIKAIGFYSGFGKTPAEFAKTNRMKKIKLFFSTEYRGGIGLNRICFDSGNNYEMELKDTQELQIIYFNKPVPAKSLRILIEDTYIGYDNITGLNEIIFFGETRRSM